MLSIAELERRKVEVVRAVVAQHIATGMPVGSQTISKRSGGLRARLSPATVRHIMAELEETGFLSQPHASAGRVPTALAYRLYADQIKKSASLSPSVKNLISREVRSTDAETGGWSVEGISLLLSQISHNVGMVMGPKRSEILLEHVKLVRLPEKRILVVIVSKPDLVEHKVIGIDEDEEMPQVDLDRAANYLNVNFRGWTLSSVRRELYRRMKEERHRFEGLKRHLALLVRKGILPTETSSDLFVDGAANLIDRVEFPDLRRAKELLATLMKKEKLVKILSECMHGAGDTIEFVIGDENPDKGMRDCTVIMAPYLCGDRAIGALGVLGPTRMEYGRAITAVRYTARLLSQRLGSN